ncbi:hypothetical protein CASFOL_005882 [Castilleja foliolosa]|uniref:KIB1-4 beta-propeller domain-containing protein n=1 Tax=Castilleja foliolosa TaxID=1961234 RepID=A0ABD3E8P2_9LAMI
MAVRWAKVIGPSWFSQWRFEVKHIKGKDNFLPDFLSRTQRQISTIIPIIYMLSPANPPEESLRSMIASMPQSLQEKMIDTVLIYRGLDTLHGFLKLYIHRYGLDQGPLLHLPYHPQTIYRPVDGTSHTMRIPILVRKYVIASTHGWLVLLDMFIQECCLWNPVSEDMIKLPRLQDFGYYKKSVLSKPPTEPDCHILFISDDLLLQAFCKIGDVEFVCPTQVEEVDRLIAITSFQGKIYGVMSTDYKFVTIEFVGKTMEFRPVMIDGEQTLKAPVKQKLGRVKRD